ncbi:MAG: transglycosylase domain-containing protein [Leptospirales bacterium]|nr:transglycosylase domain-containing protein [Leptospirales bacterium]
MRQAWLTLIWILLFPACVYAFQTLAVAILEARAGFNGSRPALLSADGRLLLREFDALRSSAPPPTALASIDRLPEACLVGLLFQEDQQFYEHRGLSLRELSRSLRRALAGGRLRGASTITQQLARSLFLSRERTLWRKVREARMAQAMEASFSKREILELYLNRVYWGGAESGLESAAQRRFGRPASRLDREQCAMLVAGLPSPALCADSRNCRDLATLRRKRRILSFLEKRDRGRLRGEGEPFRVE